MENRAPRRWVSPHGWPAVGWKLGTLASGGEESALSGVGFGLGAVAALALDYFVLAKPGDEAATPMQFRLGGSF